MSGPWLELERHFREAAPLPPAARAAYLTGALGDDQALAEKLQELLDAHDRLEAGGSSFLETLDAARSARLLDETVPDAPAGEAVGRYRIIRTLGRGGMGVVYLAYDAELDRPVALKLLSAAAAPDRLLDEARAASALDHPHIGTVYEVGRTDDGRPFIAMGCYDEGTLRDRLGAGPLPPSTVMVLARQIAGGLAAAHARGIVHRDLKPENLVFDRRASVKLVDFGLALGRSSGGSSSDSGRGGRVARAPALRGGTRAYMSPEQRRGESVDARTDVWAFGVLVLEMLTGRRPDTETGLDPDVPAEAPRDYALPPDTPRALAALLHRCLEPDPARRPASGEALFEVLGTDAPDIASLPGAADAAARADFPVRRRRRNTVLALTAGAFIFTAVAFAVVVTDSMSKGPDAEGEAAGGFPERGWVLVADFDAADDAAGLAMAAREALAVDLQQSEFVRVMSRAQVAGVLSRMGVGADVTLAPSLAMEVAERFGAGAVLAATISKAGPDYVISGRALDPRTGTELFALRTAGREVELLVAVERLSREMRSRLGESAAAIARSLPLPEVTTSSLEALRLYAEAEREMARDGEQAGALVAAAIAADSSFAMAHRLAGAAAASLLRFDEAMEHFTRAYEHRARLPERERWHIEAIYFANVAFEPRRAAAAYELLVSRYPDDARAWNSLGVMRQAWLGDHEGAFEAFDRAATLDPTQAAPLNNGTYAAYVVDRRDRADSLAQMAEAAGVATFRQRWRVARAFAEGNAQMVVAGCEQLLAIASPTVYGGTDDAEVCGTMDIASGRLESGVERLTRARDAAVQDGRYRNATHLVQALVVASLLSGDTAAASAQVDWFLDRVSAHELLGPDRFISRTNLRVQTALFGMDEREARVAAAYPPHTNPEHWFARNGEALVAAAHHVRAGDGAAALRALEQGHTPGHVSIDWRFWEQLLRGLAHEQTGELDAAARHLRAAADRRFLTHPFATKERIHRWMALEALARMDGRQVEQGGPARTTTP